MRRVSPLTRRILGVNVFALLVLAGGIFYLDRYRNNLIDAEFETITAQSRLLAGVLAEIAVEEGEGDPDQLTIPVETARLLVRRIVSSSAVRVRLYGGGGQLVTDSTLIGRGQAAIQVLPLPTPPKPWNHIRAHLASAYDWVFNTLPRRDNEPPFPEGLEPFLARFPEGVAAFQGAVGRARYARRDGHLELSVAVPLERFRRIAGVLIVSRSSLEIDDAVRALRLDIARATLAALVVTVLLSFYLSRAITRPLAKLALAADRIRHGDRSAVIPDLSRRGDEIGELAASFRAMTEALARRVSEIEAFAADVAHELKNPLTSIRSALETLPRLSDEGKRGQLLALVHADIKRIDRLISDIAAASRLDGELARGDVSAIDLNRLVEALVAVHPETAPPLVLDGKPGILVSGQEDRLVQVLRNLITNAISFSPDSGAIRVTVQADGPRAILLVDDDGPGIPPGREAAIFDRFYTERPAGEAFGQHSGLGLSISRQIIAAHDGTIVAENRTDGAGAVIGARFRIALPRIAS